MDGHEAKNLGYLHVVIYFQTNMVAAQYLHASVEMNEIQQNNCSC